MLHFIKFKGKKNKLTQKKTKMLWHLFKLVEILRKDEKEHCILAPNMTFVLSLSSFRSLESEHKFVDTLADILSKLVKR